MKLDRNVNPDGKGKYALINLRTNKVEWGGKVGTAPVAFEPVWGHESPQHQQPTKGNQ